MAETKTVQTEGTKNQPILRINMRGLVSASVFENNVQTEDGRSFTTQSIVLNRRYKDANGEYKSTNSFRVSDLAKLRIAIEQVERELYTWTGETTETAEVVE